MQLDAAFLLAIQTYACYCSTAWLIQFAYFQKSDIPELFLIQCL